MEGLRELRRRRGWSQRVLAERAGVAFRTVQLVESGAHDVRLSTLGRILRTLGRPAGALERAVERGLERDPDSIAGVSERICLDGIDSWPIHLFNFVDAFRREPRASRVEEAPDPGTPARAACLLASTVETLCGKAGVPVPPWCQGIPSLEEPWFVSGVEALKATALVHSPVAFRKRNVFVLDNFLGRA